MLKIQEIKEIIDLIDQSSITEFTYEHDDSKINIKKETQVVTNHIVEEIAPKTVNNQPTIIEEAKQVTKSTTQTNQTVEETVVADNTTVEIVSPMVGTFYSKPSPDSDIYVKPGSKVDENTVVCIVEAMKLFNEIEAEVTGEIVEVLVGDGELVEFGQPLFTVKTK